MAFVNEFVSDEDVKKYDLEGLYKKWRKETPPNFLTEWRWTVDREKDSYFIRMQTGYGTDRERADHVRGVLYYRGVQWKVEFRYEPGCSNSFSDHHFRMIWGFVSIKHPEGGSVPEAELLPVLKEALIAYKVWGIDTSAKLTDIVTTFTF